MKNKIGIFVGLVLFCTALYPIPAKPQNQGIRQSGPVTSTHAGAWTYNGILQDAGTSLIPFTTTFGLWGTGTPFCINDVQITSSTIGSTPYHQLCMGYTTGSAAAEITLNSFNGSTQIPLDLIINGTTYSIGGTNWLSAIFDQQFGSAVGDLVCRGTTAWVALGAGTAGQVLTSNGTSGCPQWTSPGGTTTPLLRAVASGTTDTAQTTDGTIVWDSASTSAKTETLYACNSGNNGKLLFVKDAHGNAGTYNITLSPAGGNTIDGASSYVIAFNYQAVSIQCYGATNMWVTL